MHVLPDTQSVWVKELIDNLDAKAKATGSKIVPFWSVGTHASFAHAQWS